MAGARRNLRPQDILVALKLAVIEGRKELNQKQLAESLSLSQGEIAFSLDRLVSHGLLQENKLAVKRAALLELLVHGLKYFFPADISARSRGMPTGLSHKSLKKSFRTAEVDQIVWPDEEGTARGMSLEPIYSTVPFAAKNDEALYELLAYLDVLRLGGARETNVATKALEKALMGDVNGK
jgi:hypothetical protein